MFFFFRSTDALSTISGKYVGPKAFFFFQISKALNISDLDLFLSNERKFHSANGVMFAWMVSVQYLQ